MCLICMNLIDNIDINPTDLTCCVDITKIPTLVIFSNITELDCNFCNIIELPANLINLKTLSCTDCTGLTLLPDTFTQLTMLDCERCVNLISLPNTFSNLTYLDCVGCISLTEIPNTYISLVILYCYYCIHLVKVPYNVENISCDNWLNHHHNYKYNFTIQKIKFLQNWFRRNIRYWIFKRWIKSEEGVKWIYDSSRIGGKVSKLNIMQSIISVAY